MKLRRSWAAAIPSLARYASPVMATPDQRLPPRGHPTLTACGSGRLALLFTFL